MKELTKQDHARIQEIMEIMRPKEWLERQPRFSEEYLKVAIMLQRRYYAQEIGLAKEVQGLSTHSLRATGATNALQNGSDIAEVQVWLGHADISTTRLYDHRRRRPEESPTFRVRF